MDTRDAFHVTESGVPDGRAMIFAHGFGCDQNMWRLVAPAFEDRFRVIRFDYVGSGRAEQPYDPERYTTLAGYAEDLTRICRDLDLDRTVLVSHSVSSMIGVLADLADATMFDALVMVSPSPAYLNDEDYRGGFEAEEIDELLGSLESNYLGWSSAMAPVIMGNPDRPALAAELEASFCTVDPAIAERFARATFLSDNRADLPQVATPTLVLQSRVDAIAPPTVGTFVADAVQDGTLVVLDAIGHCPHLSAPAQVVSAIDGYLAQGR